MSGNPSQDIYVLAEEDVTIVHVVEDQTVVQASSDGETVFLTTPAEQGPPGPSSGATGSGFFPLGW